MARQETRDKPTSPSKFSPTAAAGRRGGSDADAGTARVRAVTPPRGLQNPGEAGLPTFDVSAPQEDSRPTRVAKDHFVPEHMLPSKETEISIQSWLLEDSHNSMQKESAV